MEALLPAKAINSRQIMMLRNMAGRPLRSALTVTGIAFAVPMVVLGVFWRDAIDQMIDVQFSMVERGNTMVTFPHPLDRKIVRDLSRAAAECLPWKASELCRCACGPAIAVTSPR